MNILQLPDLEITKYEEKTIKDCEYIVLSVCQPDYNPKCPFCKSMPRVHERSNKAIRDLDAFGKNVILDVEYRKYQCLSSNKHFSEQFESIDSRSRMTKRLRDKISYEAFDYSFTELERRYGLSDTTIKTAFAYWQKEMDDKKINSFTSFFDQLQDIKKVKIINMDMSGGYKTMAYDYFGKNIVIIVDKYHMVARISKAFFKGYNILVSQIEDKSAYSYIDNRMSILRRNYEELNKDDRKILAKLFKAIKGLDGIYKLKESFRAIYLNDNKKDAKQALINWLESIPNDPEYKDFKTASKTINARMSEILNYFDYPYTNAFTEGFNSFMKRVNRIGNGYSFNVLRGKLLYGSSKTSFYSVKKEIIKKH